LSIDTDIEVFELIAAPLLIDTRIGMSGSVRAAEIFEGMRSDGRREKRARQIGHFTY
jgi:hypothetical protein